MKAKKIIDKQEELEKEKDNAFLTEYAELSAKHNRDIGAKLLFSLSGIKAVPHVVRLTPQTLEK